MSAPKVAGEKPSVLEPAKLAELIANSASDVKAMDVTELDLRGVLGYTDYFIVATGGTDRQVKAIHDRIHERLKREHGAAPAARRGRRRGALDPDGLPRRDRPHLHARGARLLPARAALGRSAQARHRVDGRPSGKRVGPASGTRPWSLVLGVRNLRSADAGVTEPARAFRRLNEELPAGGVRQGQTARTPTLRPSAGMTSTANRLRSSRKRSSQEVQVEPGGLEPPTS